MAIGKQAYMCACVRVRLLVRTYTQSASQQASGAAIMARGSSLHLEYSWATGGSFVAKEERRREEAPVTLWCRRRDATPHAMPPRSIGPTGPGPAPPLIPCERPAVRPRVCYVFDRPKVQSAKGVSVNQFIRGVQSCVFIDCIP